MIDWKGLLETGSKDGKSTKIIPMSTKDLAWVENKCHQ